MRALMLIFAVIAMLFAGLILGASKSAIHEILAGIAFLLSAVFLAAFAVMGAIEEVLIELRAMRKDSAGQTRTS